MRQRQWLELIKYYDILIQYHPGKANVEFAYNNSFHSSIGMAPYEEFYKRTYRSPIYWTEVGERQILGPEIVQLTTDKIKVIQQRP